MFKNISGWLGRNRAVIVALLVTLFVVLYLDGLRNFLSSKLNEPIAASVLALSPWISWMRIPIHWLLMGLEIVGMVWVLARVVPPAFGFLGHAIPDFRSWAALPEKDRHRRHVLVWVFVGAISSALFTGTLILTLVGAYHFKFITPGAIQEIAFLFWPTVCFVEIIMQIVPMIVRQQTQGWDVVADQATSFFPMTGCLLILGLIGFGLFGMGAEGWLVWEESLFTAFIELALLALSNKLIAAARGEERA
jgi:hypothetical protein